jgi:hypothetical protein
MQISRPPHRANAAADSSVTNFTEISVRLKAEPFQNRLQYFRNLSKTVQIILRTRLTCCFAKQLGAGSAIS